MAIDLDPFTNIPADWFYVFTVEGVSAADAERALEITKRHLKAAEVHPYTAFMAHDMLSREWQDILESGITWEEVQEFKPVCVWADIWGDATDAGLEIACRNLPSGAIKTDIRIDWPGNRPYEAFQSYLKLRPEIIEARKKMNPPPKEYRFSGYFE